jgi:uroporphyrin-III C-methyltransferase
MNGKVWLVGAGPGDPELLTLKALKALRQADVVLVDDLVSDEILEYARPDARIVHVGKRGGCKSTPQEFIERLMVSEAGQGHMVVRLKGGDPFVFGRGAEECEALREAGIDFEVVNGITAGLAAATALGIPLTHRDLCHGAILVTGHEHDGDATDWRALVASRLTLVIYMGLTRAPRIQEALLSAGMEGATPAAVVSNATRSDERSIVTRLDQLAAEVARAGLESPAIMIVGKAVRLARAVARPARTAAGNPAPSRPQARHRLP